MANKFVWLFDQGNAKMRNILGGKGANLAEMTRLKLPVPYGFTISTLACANYYKMDEELSSAIQMQIIDALRKVEKVTCKKFGDAKCPLLISIRSGARVSMPGMMDSILNLGLNDETVEGLAKISGDRRFAFDSYRRFVSMYANVVMKLDSSFFEKELSNLKKSKGVTLDTELECDDLVGLVKSFKKIYSSKLGQEFPSDPFIQLISAVKAVFNSWNNSRAIAYRRMNNIPSDWGTAVNVQTMVYGNLGLDSGTGVAFTRNPATGLKELYGEYLMNAQGEDVVAGIRTPLSISHLREQSPEIYNQFLGICDRLEKHYHDMQDMEFTIEKGKLYMLQTRNGKRTAMASLQIAVDLVKEGLITEKEALLSIEPKQLDALLHPTFDTSDLATNSSVAKGLPASPGSVAGMIALSTEKARVIVEDGGTAILVRGETSPEDIEGMQIAKGVLTATGGITSHAAVVARGMGIACVVGCGELSIDEKNSRIKLGNTALKEGDTISIDGSSGLIYLGVLKTVPAGLCENFATITNWADKYRKIGIYANAETTKDIETALKFGAEGIGLARTEHMFFDAKRIGIVRQMILAETEKERKSAISKLLPFQKKDFEAMFKLTQNKPVTIRLIDPPLHEFLPKTEEDIRSFADEVGKDYEVIKNQIASLKEFNPMMGHRGCRLLITYPELARMQTCAIIEAGIKANDKYNLNVAPNIMIPLVGGIKEMKFVADIIRNTAEECKEKLGKHIDYKIGTMIELPRACMVADELAEVAEFFSFGTNDLSQMTYGISRDDAGKFLQTYYKNQIYEIDPFVRIDEQGVGALMQIAIKKAGGRVRSIGVCGEQGGDPHSIAFCKSIGVNYVSCSPFRVAIARIAGAQAEIMTQKN